MMKQRLGEDDVKNTLCSSMDTQHPVSWRTLHWKHLVSYLVQIYWDNEPEQSSKGRVWPFLKNVNNFIMEKSEWQRIAHDFTYECSTSRFFSQVVFNDGRNQRCSSDDLLSFIICNA